MAENWQSFKIDLGPINPLAERVKDITDAINAALVIQKTALDFIASIALDLLNVEALLIKAALESIEALLEEYLVADAKLHALVVPPRRQLSYKLPSNFGMPQEEDSWAINDALSEEDKARFQAMLLDVAESDQGNKGFARTYVESIYDEFDPNKPEYDENAAVFGVAIVAGAQSMLQLYNLLNTLNGIFGTSLRGNPLIPATVTPTPQNVTAQPIAAPETTRIGVRLDWNNAPALQTLAEYDGARVTIQEIAIVRSTDDQVPLASSWEDIFGAYQPSTLDVPEIENIFTTPDGKTVIRHVQRHDGIRDSYVDDDESLEKDIDYYYFVAYRYALAEDFDGTNDNIEFVPQNFFDISNVVKVRVNPDKIPSTHLAVQPNWLAYGSFLDMIPDLRFFFRLLENYIASLKSQLLGSASALQSYVAFLQAEIDRYTEFAAEINNRVAKLARFLQIPATGIFITTISAESGGMEFFTRELLERLTDETDTSAPPFFDNGLVGGLVLVAGAPNPAELAPVQTLMSLLLGLGDQTENAYQKAVDTIDVVLREAENATL